jgi:hypothetical protein
LAFEAPKLRRTDRLPGKRIRFLSKDQEARLRMVERDATVSADHRVHAMKKLR